MMFGHNVPINEYREISLGTYDNIGTLHGAVTARCQRCGERVTVARVHLNSAAIMDFMAKYSPEDFQNALDRKARVNANQSSR